MIIHYDVRERVVKSIFPEQGRQLVTTFRLDVIQHLRHDEADPLLLEKIVDRCKRLRRRVVNIIESLFDNFSNFTRSSI